MLDTKERILDTAERLFADRGYAGTSLRTIIAEAQVNLAAVHYHFHSKEALLEAIILRRAGPANEERLALLDACELAANGRAPELESIIEAFVAPMFHMAQDSKSGGLTFMRLMGRLYAEGNILPGILMRHFTPLLERFLGALRRALPDLPTEELLWRLHLAIGATSQALRGVSKDREFMAGLGLAALNSDMALQRLVSFLSAGLRAPVAVVATTQEN